MTKQTSSHWKYMQLQKILEIYIRSATRTLKSYRSYLSPQQLHYLYEEINIVTCGILQIGV